METTTSNKNNPIKNLILDAALGYLKEGLSVVRVRPGLKRAYGYWDEYKEHLPTEKDLNDWFKSNYYQVGIVCGLVSGGFFALDFDGENWLDWYEMFAYKFPEVMKTRTVMTGSGRFHVWCRCKNLSNIIERLNGKGKVERIFPGEREAIELRLNNHLVMAPPSIHPDGEYYKFLNKSVEAEPFIHNGMIGWAGWSGYAGTANPILDFSEERVWEMVEFLREGKPVKQVKPHGEIPELTKERQTRLANFYVRCVLRQVNNGASRNDKGFQLGCNLRNLGLEREDAIPFIGQYQEDVPERDHPYSIDEAISSLESAYEDERQEWWIPDGFFGPDDSDLTEENIQSLLDFHLTDAGNAESFIGLHGGRFIFIPEKKMWFMWDGVRWFEEGFEAWTAMIETARTRNRLSIRLAEERQKPFRKWNTNSENQSRVKSALESASRLRNKTFKLFDAEPFILCCENGVVNLRTGEFRRSTHNDWISKSTDISYDPEARCPRWT